MDPKDSSPSVVVVAGPNGAGKSTTAEALLADSLAVDEFVNADVIAHGLSGFAGESTAFAAGRIMLARIRDLAARRVRFAFETTLASRSFAPWLRALSMAGYQVHVVYLWLPSPDLAVLRVQQRMRAGGHGLPEATVRRRYQRSVGNFLRLYRPLATSWHVYDNGAPPGARLIARGGLGRADEVVDATAWRALESRAGGGDAP